MFVNKINNKILLIIIVLLPLNNILINYLFTIGFFQPINAITHGVINATLVANGFSVLIFSLIIIVLGKNNWPSMWIDMEKLKFAFILIFIIWFISQLSMFAYTLYHNQEILFIDNITIKVGNILAQLLGNSLFEEMIYRGVFFIQIYLVLISKFSERISICCAILISSILFAINHIPHRLMVYEVDNLFIDISGLIFVGILITIIFIKTENLAFVIGFHALMNEPFNIIKVDFSPDIIIFGLTVISVLSWHKIKASNRNYLLPKKSNSHP